MNKFTHLTVAVAATLLANTGAALADAAPRSRADVIAELNAARISGELAAMSGEDSGSAWLSRQPQAAAPAAVHAEQAAPAALPHTSTQAQALSGDCSASMFAEDSGSFCLAALPDTTFMALPRPSPALRYAGPGMPEKSQPAPGAAEAG